MSQLLSQFQSVFSTDPVRIEFNEFAKDGAFTKEVVKQFKAAGFDALYLKPLTSKQRANFEMEVSGVDGKRDLHNLYARLVALSWCQEDGTAVGTADEVGSLRADVVTQLFFRVQKLNGMDQHAVDDAGKG